MDAAPAAERPTLPDNASKKLTDNADVAASSPPREPGEGHAAHRADPNPRDWQYIAAALLKSRSSREQVIAILEKLGASSCLRVAEFIDRVVTNKNFAKLLRDFPRDAQEEPESIMDLESYDSVEKQHLEYFWKPYIPIGKYVHLGGKQAVGKSPVLRDVIARMSSGAVWPDGSKNELGPRSVILLAAEDDPSDTIKPALELSGANLQKIYRAQCSLSKDQTKTERMFALDRDIQGLASAARSVRDLALIVLDPINNYLGNVKYTDDPAVRAVLMPLVLLARELRITVIVCGHLNRREKGTDSLDRLLGAAAFSGVARFVYLAGPDPDDAQNPYAHVLVQRRGVGAPSLKYQTIVKQDKWKERSSDIVVVEWCGTSTATGDDVVDPASQKEKSRDQELGKALKLFLGAGQRSPTEARLHLKEIGLFNDPDEINWSRVCRLAGAESERLKGGRNNYVWRLKTGQTEF